MSQLPLESGIPRSSEYLTCTGETIWENSDDYYQLRYNDSDMYIPQQKRQKPITP